MKDESPSPIDIAAAHRHFSTACFNEAWTVLEQQAPAKDDIETMLHLAHASYYHWSRRADFHPQNQSIGLWQLSRAYELAGQSYMAVHYARQCIEVSESNQLEPFYRAYAHEAMARAQRDIGLHEEAAHSLRFATELAEKVKDKRERAQLMKDLEAISTEPS